MAEYSINKIFYSIQGEGMLTGTPAVFIHFAGCNMRCRYCDTDYGHVAFMDTFEILNKVRLYCGKEHDKRPLVVFTGGEPTIQNYDSLLQQLHLNDFRVQIETNGTNAIYPFLPSISPIITVSPKSPDYKQRVGHELKVIYRGQTLDVLQEYRSMSHFQRYSLQPLWPQEGKPNTKETVAMVLRDPCWTLSVQTQKYLEMV